MCTVFSRNLFVWEWNANPMPKTQPGAPGCLGLEPHSCLSSLGDPTSKYITASIALEHDAV
jgi:hypothetical protein